MFLHDLNLPYNSLILHSLIIIYSLHSVSRSDLNVKGIFREATPGKANVVLQDLRSHQRKIISTFSILTVVPDYTLFSSILSVFCTFSFHCRNICQSLINSWIHIYTTMIYFKVIWLPLKSLEIPISNELLMYMIFNSIPLAFNCSIVLVKLE